MRADNPPGMISISWPTDKDPSIKVPVTTVPNPLIEKDRSIGNLGLLRSFFTSVLLSAASIVSNSSTSPTFVAAETDTISASLRAVSYTHLTLPTKA